MKKKDWTGNDKSVYTTLGSSNHSDKDRSEYDYYATDPIAIEKLIDDGGVKFSSKILEPCAGEGHLAEKLKEYGYKVTTADIIERNYKLDGIWDFLNQNKKWHGDIVTNPPYNFAYEFIEKSLDMIDIGNRVFMFLKLQFLEGKKRTKLFKTNQLKTLYVSSSRILCAKNGVFDGSSSAVAYAWYEFEKGFNGNPIIKWIN